MCAQQNTRWSVFGSVSCAFVNFVSKRYRFLVSRIYGAVWRQHSIHTIQHNIQAAQLEQFIVSVALGKATQSAAIEHRRRTVQPDSMAHWLQTFSFVSRSVFSWPFVVVVVVCVCGSFISTNIIFFCLISILHKYTTFLFKYSVA